MGYRVTGGVKSGVQSDWVGYRVTGGGKEWGTE